MLPTPIQLPLTSCWWGGPMLHCLRWCTHSQSSFVDCAGRPLLELFHPILLAWSPDRSGGLTLNLQVEGHCDDLWPPVTSGIMACRTDYSDCSCPWWQGKDCGSESRRLLSHPASIPHCQPAEILRLLEILVLATSLLILYRFPTEIWGRLL